MTGIGEYLSESSAASAALARAPGAAAIERAATLTADALARGGTLLLCGNGGSAAQAQHLAAELVGRMRLERRGYAAVALTTDTSVLTAVGNDYRYEDVFARQVQALARPGDVLAVLTTSGRSPNVQRAALAAREAGCQVVAFLGPGPSPLDALADVALHCPGGAAEIVQQSHMVVGHALCAHVEAELARTARSRPAAAAEPQPWPAASH